jgi:ABC-type branched-subunit amino acid transport system ATPase component/ABC-type branched-subunit amino acid transport system permease subunit
MLRGLVAAAIARFVSVGVAFAAGIVIGVIDVVIRSQSATSGLLDLILLATALVVLLVRPIKGGRESSGDGDWTKLTLRRVPSAYRRFWLTRHFGVVMGVLTLVMMATAVPVWFLDNSSAFVLVQVFAYGIVGLSVLVLTGKGGQLSLGQFAVAAVGAVVSVRVVAATDVFILGPVAAIATGAVVTAILGLPTLRTRGPVLAITTLAFALATRSWILPQEWAIGEGLAADQPVIGSVALDSSTEYYFYSLVILGLAAWATRWYVVSRSGRELVALRDNEGAARALGVPVTMRKMQMLLVAGALAGLGGSLLAHSRNLISTTDFPATASIEVVVLAVVGGISVVSGPLLGAVIAVGVPALAGLDALATAGLQALFLVLVLFRPAGLVSVLTPVRDWWLEEWARVRGHDPATLVDDPAPQDSPFARSLELGLLAAGRAPDQGSVVLELDGVSKRFGGVRAVQGVTLHVADGEAVAVIGPNGAGKTTLFEIASGFVRPDEGTVRLAGSDVTELPPERRTRRGLVRSFQNALLFPTLDVRDTVALALSRRPRAAGDVEVDRVLEVAGLTPYADTPVGTLSTGVRRMVELTCDLALAPRVALLDEPSAGISHHEIPALAALIQSMRTELGITLVVIDHDMTLLRTCCERFVALELGEVVATGAADEVLTDARVVAAFLGTNAAAVDRSGLAGQLTPTGD